MKKLKFLILGSIFLTSCGVGNLTTQQKNEIIKINKQIDDLWNEHYYKIDRLYKYEGMYANQEWDKE